MKISISFTNITPFEEEKVKIDLAKNITTFVGPNGSGKTTLLSVCYEVLKVATMKPFRQNRSFKDLFNEEGFIFSTSWDAVKINFEDIVCEINEPAIAQGITSLAIELHYDNSTKVYIIHKIWFDDTEFEYFDNMFISDLDTYKSLKSKIVHNRKKFREENAKEGPGHYLETLDEEYDQLLHQKKDYELPVNLVISFWNQFEFPELIWIEKNSFEEAIDSYTSKLRAFRDEAHSHEEGSNYRNEISRLDDYLNSKVTLVGEPGKDDVNYEILVDKKSITKLSMGTYLGLSFYALIYGSSKETIVFWDEPENSMHTTRRFKLRELMQKDSRRFLIATHQTEFCPINDLYSNVYKLWSKFETSWEHSESYIAKVENLEESFSILKSLGMEPSKVLFTSNCVIWVEGPSDLVYWRFWIEEYLKKEKIELTEGYDYSFMIYGGSGLNALTVEFDSDDQRDDIVRSFVNVLNITPASIFLYDVDFPKEVWDELALGDNADTFDKEMQIQSKLKARVVKIIEKTKQLNKEMNHLTLPTYGREVENYLDENSFIQALKTLYELKEGNINELKVINNIKVGRWDSFDEVIISAIENTSSKPEEIPLIRGSRKKEIAGHKTALTNKIGFASAYVRSFTDKEFNFSTLRCGDHHVKKLINLILKIKRDYNQ